MLREAGQRVRIDVEYRGEPAELLIAIHAWRSAESILRYRERYPEGPLIVCLSGTDVNTYLESHPQPTLRSMEMADALICLHDHVGAELPASLQRRLHVIHQSATPLPSSRQPSARKFDVCVVGHLRDVKDPFRTALAARRLPPDSRLRITHLGKAHTPDFADQAAAEMASNSRYRWLGEVPHWRVRRELARTHLMVISSSQEGGANVVSEAIVAGVPVIASDIPGNVGLLGRDYPGYFPARDEEALSVLLHRAETEPEFLDALAKDIRKLKPLFRHNHEQAALDRVVKSVTGKGLNSDQL
jgi:putative glycosyltransferase (TIGR04348 family)